MFMIILKMKQKHLAKKKSIAEYCWWLNLCKRSEDELILKWKNDDLDYEKAVNDNKIKKAFKSAIPFCIKY